jgi:hypothetical protein
MTTTHEVTVESTLVVGIEPVLVSAKVAAATAGVARSTWLAWDAAGICPRPIRLGGRVLWALDGPNGLRTWVAKGCPSRERFEQRQGGGV